MGDWPAHIPAEWKPKPEDELLHVPMGDESLPWKDTFFFTVRDPERNANITMHMTVSGNRSPNTRVTCGAAQGNNITLQTCREDGTHNEKQIGNSMCRVEIINLSWDSDHEIRLVGDLDEVSFDLNLKGKHWAPLWDTMLKGFFARGSEDGSVGQFYCHTEQIVVVDGTITWKNDGIEQPFQGFGWRDRGWGRRKTQLMWNTGWDLVGGVLPDDSVFSFMALRSHEIPEPAPMPIAGWWADATSLSPLVGGFYHKEATMAPLEYRLEFENGHVIEAKCVRPTGRIATALQDAEFGVPGMPNMTPNMMDWYALMRDPAGNEFEIFTQCATMHRLDVFQDGQFIRAGNPPIYLRTRPGNPSTWTS